MKIIARILIAATGLFNLVGCYDAGIKQTIHETGFVYCESGSFDVFNPQISDENSILEAISAQIYDRLLIIDPITQKPSSNLASDWQIDETGTVYTFNLLQMWHFIPLTYLRQHAFLTRMMLSLVLTVF